MKPRILIILSVILFSAFQMQAQSKMGYINSLELLSYMPEVKNADSILKGMADDMQKQYVAYIQEYQLRLDEYNKLGATWSDVKKEATETDLLAFQERISTFEEASQQKIEAKKQELYNPAVAKANEAIQNVGKEQKLICIIDASTGSLIYAGEDLVNVLPMVKLKLGIN